MVDAQRLAGELGRGAYDARRAAALAGVPRSTLHYWARKDFYRPSVSPEPHVRLWSWLDLLACGRSIGFARLRGRASRAESACGRSKRRSTRWIERGFRASDCTILLSSPERAISSSWSAKT